jgi:hypothetical protein
MFWVLGALNSVCEAHSLPLDMSPLYRFGEHVSMREIGAEMFDNHVFVCHLFCHPKVPNVDVAGPLRSAIQVRLSWYITIGPMEYFCFSMTFLGG